MGILDLKLQYFPGQIWKPKPIGELTLRQFIDSHRNPKPEILEVFKKIKEAEEKGDMELKGMLKTENLFYFTPCVQLDGKGRSYSNILYFNGILILDFDHLVGSASKFRDAIFNKLKSVILTYVSPSGHGVKCFVKIPKVKSVEEFKEYFFGLAYELEHIEAFDGSGQNSCLPLFLSYDYDLKFREDAETWTQRGGKYDVMEEFTGEFEPLEDVEEGDRLDILKKCRNIMQKADIQQVGHGNVIGSSTILGGHVAAGYISLEEAESYLYSWIDDSPYLSQKSNTYKKTAQTMLKYGTKSPLFLDKHSDRIEREETTVETVKRDRKYYLLTNKCEFKISHK